MTMSMKKVTAGVLMGLGLATCAPIIVADDALPITANVGFITDYTFRGVSQTDAGPGMQGGFDYAPASGFYIGAWGASVHDFASTGGLELDIYGGYKFQLTDDLLLDVGLLQYLYPNNNNVYLDGDADTTEAYLGATWKWLNAKYSYTPKYFGTGEAGHYLEANLAVPLSDMFTLGAHIGHNSGDGVELAFGETYNDYKIGATASYAGFAFELAYVDTDLDLTGNDYAKGAVTFKASRSF